MSKMLIGICGRAGAGKSTLAKVLNAPTVSFATPLKNMLKCLGLTDEHLYGSLKEVPLPDFGGKTTRYLMQTLGTEWGRNLVDENLWANRFATEVQNHSSGLVLCDDVRYVSEIETIRRLGGFLVEIRRPGIEKGVHSSETLDFSSFGIPFVINDSTPEVLAVRVKTLLYGQR